MKPHLALVLTTRAALFCRLRQGSAAISGLVLMLAALLLLPGCAVVTVASVATSAVVGTAGLAADAAIGTARIAGKTVGAVAGAVLPGSDK